MFWLAGHYRPCFHTGGAHEAEPLEHRSGVGGVPYFNLIEYMDEAVLAAEIVSSLRDEWLPAYPRDGPFLPGLDAALAAAAARAPMAAGATGATGAAGAAGAAGEALAVVVTFANLGYADFVLNGFARAAVPNTLVVALDALAHAAFREAGLVSFFDERMPTIGAEQQDHRSAGFMDMMKLRLLYATEVLLRGYSLLLTDADAVFVGSPFAVFAPQAALSVACDSTVVPKTWREAPGMVMAGFFFARAGVRPIIFLKEVLDYQARHPEQHDQQSFNQILSELLVADLSVSVMHPRLFPNGFQYFVKRTVQREGGAPLVVQNNWMMGADNKRHRFREAHLWKLDPPAYYGADPAAPPLRLLRYSAEQPAVSGLLRETSALRSALRLATLLNRTLVLPTFCGFTSASGLVPPPPLQYRDTLGAINRDVLDDTVDGDWCTAEWYYDMQAMAAEWGGAYRESSFLAHPQVPPAVLDTRGAPPFFIEAAASWRLVPPPEGATVLRPARLEAGPTDAELLDWLAPHAEVPMLVFGDMAGRLDPLARPLGPAGSGSGGGGGGGGGDDDFLRNTFGGKKQRLGEEQPEQSSKAAGKAKMADATSSGDDDEAASGEGLTAEAYRAQNSISTVGAVRLPDPVQSFEDSPFDDRLKRSLIAAGFAAPSAIQAQAWPVAMSGADVIAIAKTGSGKTVGFLLPAFQAMLPSLPLKMGQGPMGLVMAPVREVRTRARSPMLAHAHATRAPCPRAPTVPRDRTIGSGALAHWPALHSHAPPHAHRHKLPSCRLPPAVRSSRSRSRWRRKSLAPSWGSSRSACMAGRPRGRKSAR